MRIKSFFFFIPGFFKSANYVFCWYLPFSYLPGWGNSAIVFPPPSIESYGTVCTTQVSISVLWGALCLYYDTSAEPVGSFFPVLCFVAYCTAKKSTEIF